MLTIRPARYSDAEAAFDIRIQAIRHQCIAVYTRGQIEAWTQVPLTEHYRASVQRHYHIGWWEKVPIATGYIDFQSGELGALFVLPAFMGQGIGKAMLRYLETLALKAGVAKIHLDATPNAKPFYQRCGYHGEVGGIYTSPSGLELACTPMHKKLIG